MRQTPARYPLVITPTGFERYVARIAAAQAGEEPPEWALAPIPEVQRVGPPDRRVTRRTESRIVALRWTTCRTDAGDDGSRRSGPDP